MKNRKYIAAILSVFCVNMLCQNVLAADFSSGEEVFITESTEQDKELSEALTIFEDMMDSEDEKEYEATVSEEIYDFGQFGNDGSGGVWLDIEIKNTGTEAWHIKSISDLNDFRFGRSEYSVLGGRIPMKAGNEVKPGETAAVEVYVKKNLQKGLHEETFVMDTEEGIRAECRIRVFIRDESNQDYEVNCAPSSGTSFPVITQEEYDSWDNVEPDVDMLTCPSRRISIYNNGQKPVTVDFKSTKHFWAWFDNDEDTGIVMPGKCTTIVLHPKAEEQVATEIFKVSITGGIELSYTISQNCPHIPPAYPDQTQIRSVKVQGATIWAVVYDCENGEGYDAVLTKEKWDIRPANYIKTVKNQNGKTITFTNVKNGTYYLGVHAYNRDYYNGKVSNKRFGKWSYPQKVVVTNGIPAETPKIRSVKTGKRSVSLTVDMPKSYARMDVVLASTNGANVYKRRNQKTSAKFSGVNPGIYTLKIRPWLKINGKKTYGDWLPWPKHIRVK